MQSINYVPEVANKLRRSEASVWWLIKSGQLKSMKLAGRRVVTDSHLEEFFTSADEAQRQAG